MEFEKVVSMYTFLPDIVTGRWINSTMLPRWRPIFSNPATICSTLGVLFVWEIGDLAVPGEQVPKRTGPSKVQKSLKETCSRSDPIAPGSIIVHRTSSPSQLVYCDLSAALIVPMVLYLQIDTANTIATLPVPLSAKSTHAERLSSHTGVEVSFIHP